MHVVMHNAVSIDGRIDGFEPDIGLYYGLVDTWDVDAHLVGADTLIEGEQADAPIDAETVEGPDPAAAADRPLLVVTDSRGRVTSWDTITSYPYWRDVLVLCSAATPDEYRQTLEGLQLSSVVVGDDHVDLEAALEAVAARGVETVLVDSGGTLNGTLLRAGLIDEVSVLVHPVAVGGTDARSFIRGPEPGAGPTELRPLAVEQPTERTVWLRYEVVG